MVSETKDRPRKLSGETHKFPTGCGNIYVTVNKGIIYITSHNEFDVG